MELEELQYALAKQVSTIKSINTDYGTLELDKEMREAVKITLETVIEKKISKMEK